MTKVTQLKRVLAILVSVALLASCISVAGWTVAAAETVWDFEGEAIDDTNLSLYKSDSIKVSDEKNHTTGGSKSAKVISAQTAGNDRAQIIIKDGNGNAVTVAEGEIVQVSFWVYLPTQENNTSNKLRMWLSATDNDSVHSSSNPKNDAVVYEQGTGQFSVPVDSWHQVTVTTNGAHAGKLRLGIAGDNQGKQTTFYVDDVTVTREDAAPLPEATGTAYHYDFSVNNGMYNNTSGGSYYGTAAAAGSSHNNAIQSGTVETTVVPNGSGYAMQLAYTGNLAETADSQRYAIFSLPNYTSDTINKRAPGQSIHLETGSVFKITVKYKVTGYTSPATLYAATYNGSAGYLTASKSLTTDFPDNEEIVRIEGTTADWQEASAIHAPDMNNNLYILLKMDDDTNRVGTNVLISEITITPVLAGTIRFDSNGGSAVAALTGAVGDAVTMPANPTRTGYTFQGWANANGGAVPTTFVAGETTLVAQWLSNDALVMDAEDLTADEPIQLNTVANNTAAASGDYNHTYGGGKSIKVKGNIYSRERTQFFVKNDGTQVVLEKDKDYQLSFWYYIPATEGDYDLKYWFAAGDSTVPYDNDDDSTFFGERIAVSDKTLEDPVKGAWSQVVVTFKNSDREGNLRIGVCGSAAYTLYLDDIAVEEIPPFESDPNTMDFENNDVSETLNINPNGAGTITVSNAYNHTENGSQSVKFAPADQGGGTRPQMMVKDGTGAQVMVEEGKNYEFTFWLYLESTEGNYGISYWWAATEDETSFANGPAKDAAKIHEAEVRSETIKGQWTKVTVTMASNRTGKLRLGICGSDSNSKTRTFYVDDIVVKEVVPYEQDPDVESFETSPVGTTVSLGTDAKNSIVISADYNITEGGSQSALVTSNTKAGGGRAQMLIKDGEGNQVMIEKDKSYVVTFRYYIPVTEPDYVVNYWLTAADSEEFYTAGSQKDAVKLSEYSGVTGADTKGEWNEVTISIPKAAYSGKLRIGLCTNTGALAKFYIDEIKVEKTTSDVTVDPNATAWNFENYGVGMGTDHFMHGSGKVSDEQNYTKGGKLSLMVNKKTNAGIDRAQIVIMDATTGKPFEMTKGETYTLTMWVYKPSDYGDMMAINLWLMGTDEVTKINNKTNAEYDMGAPATYEASDEWFEFKVSFTAKNGKYLILGITDHSTGTNEGIFFLDDIEVKEPEYMTVKFDSNGSEDKYEDVVGIVGATVPFDGMDPYREGYEFTGWYTSKDCDIDSFFDIASQILTGKNGDVITLYAGWQEWEIGDRIEFTDDEVIEKEDEYRTEYYEEKVWVGDQNVPEPLDIGQRPEAELETITDVPVDDEPAGEEPAAEGLPTWLIIVIIAAAVLVVGGGALAALLLSKKSKTTEENNA